jgi:hypothetical protein
MGVMFEMLETVANLGPLFHHHFFSSNSYTAFLDLFFSMLTKQATTSPPTSVTSIIKILECLANPSTALPNVDSSSSSSSSTSGMSVSASLAILNKLNTRGPSLITLNYSNINQLKTDLGKQKFLPLFLQVLRTHYTVLPLFEKTLSLLNALTMMTTSATTSSSPLYQNIDLLLTNTDLKTMELFKWITANFTSQNSILSLATTLSDRFTLREKTVKEELEKKRIKEETEKKLQTNLSAWLKAIGSETVLSISSLFFFPFLSLPPPLSFLSTFLFLHCLIFLVRFSSLFLRIGCGQAQVGSQRDDFLALAW